jgi:hypothetical protein
MVQTPFSGRHRQGPPGFLLPAATMAGLALAASFGVTRVMERFLAAQGGEAAGPAATVAAGPAAGAEREPLPRGSYEQAILGRNIFDSTSRPGPSVHTPPGDFFPLGDAQLIATVVTEDRLGSTALIALGQGVEQRVAVYSLGDQLEEGSRIDRIDQGRVILEAPDGRLQRLLLGTRAEL